MADRPSLLVVDDEMVICQACRRIFSAQGFQVDASTDAREGLDQAGREDYAGILLDVKMPEMDGIEFLERLREKKPHIPVLIMTGYPSVPNAAAAVRLGASDYVTKPFTPEEITKSVQRMIRRKAETAGGPEAAAEAAPSEPAAAEPREVLFREESWVQLEEDGSASVGAVLPLGQAAALDEVRLPGIGEVVYQGLPLAGVTLKQKAQIVVPSPVSGVVVAVNEELTKDPSLLSSDPCGKGWMACICTTRLEEELNDCTARRVILANSVAASAGAECRALASLGCQVRVASSWEELAPAIQDPSYRLLLFDAASFGQQGPELVGRISAAAPSLKLVVVAPADWPQEAAYRRQKITSYTAAPFADGQIAAMVDAAFRPQRPAPEPAARLAPSESVGSINITNRNRTKVRLLAEPGLLQRDHGIGWKIRQKLTDRMFPVVATPGQPTMSPTDVVKAATTCDRLMVLTVKDVGRLPGSLVRDTKAEFGSLSGEKISRVTTLEVQPDSIGGGLAALDERTAEALAEHIVQEMASY